FDLVVGDCHATRQHEPVKLESDVLPLTGEQDGARANDDSDDLHADDPRSDNVPELMRNGCDDGRETHPTEKNPKIADRARASFDAAENEQRSGYEYPHGMQ